MKHHPPPDARGQAAHGMGVTPLFSLEAPAAEGNALRKV